jgi:CheY-like chemotaxis protein
MLKNEFMAEKLLIIDDSAIMHRAVALVLKREDINLLAASHADKGLEVLKKELPSIILLDYELPEVSIQDYVTKIRMLSPMSKIILLCGSFDQIDDSQLAAMKVDAKLWKPFEAQVLMTTIQGLKHQSNEVETQPIPIQEGEEPTGDIAREMTRMTFANLQMPNLETTKPPPPPTKVVAAPPQSFPDSLASADPTADSLSPNLESTNWGKVESFLRPEELPEPPSSLWEVDLPSPLATETAIAEARNSSISIEDIRPIVQQEVRLFFREQLKEELQKELKAVIDEIEKL